MATIIAAVGGGNWTTGATWVGGSAPGSGDDAQLTVTSGNVTIDSGGAVCRSLDCTGYTGTVTHNASSTLTIGDGTAGAGNVALKFVAGMTYTGNNTGNFSFVSTSATTQTVDFAGKTMGSVVFNGVGGSWQITGTFTQRSGAANMTLTNGTLNTNNQTCSWVTFSSTNSNTRALTLGSTSLSLSSTGTAWNTGTATGLTLTANTSTITLTGAGASFSSGGSLSFNNIVLSGSGIQQIGISTGTVANFTRTGTAALGDGLNLTSSNLTVTGALTMNGNSITNRLIVKSSTIGTARTITGNGTISISNVDFQDFTGAGSVSWDVSAITGLSGDGGNNTGLTFTGALTNYWVAGTGNWSDSANHWASSSGGTAGTGRVPLLHDTARFDSSSGGGNITPDISGIGHINMSGFTGGYPNTTQTNVIYGDMTWGSGMSTPATAIGVTLAGRSTRTITTNGLTLPGGYTHTINTASTSSYVLADNFRSAANTAILLSSGILDAATNNVNVTAPNVNLSSGTCLMGSGTWSFDRTTAGVSVWSCGAGVTLDAGTSTIVYSAATSNSRTFAGGGKTYYNFVYTVSSSSGSLVITGANTFRSFNVSDAAGARTVSFTSATTNAFKYFNVNGTSANAITVNAVTAASAATLNFPNGPIYCDYLTLQDITGTGEKFNVYQGTSTSGSTGVNFVSRRPQENNYLFSSIKASTGMSVTEKIR